MTKNKRHLLIVTERKKRRERTKKKKVNKNWSDFLATDLNIFVVVVNFD